MSKSIARDQYDAIVLASLSPAIQKQVGNLVQQLCRSSDEHGWHFGVTGTSRNWASLNWSLYGVGHDAFNRRLLAAIQVRHTTGRRSHQWKSIRKSYFLIGRNEDGTAFAHPIPSAVVRSAIRGQRQVIQAIQKWIFGVDYRRVRRQGDIGLVPVTRLPREAEGVTNDPHLLLLDSHDVDAAEVFRANETVYVRDPFLRHLPQTHPDVRAVGLFRIVEGCRAAVWKYTTP